MQYRASSPLWSRGSKAGPPKGFDSRPRTTESGMIVGKPEHGQKPKQANAWGALSHVRDRQESIRMGSHRREAPSHRGPANGLGTH